MGFSQVRASCYSMDFCMEKDLMVATRFLSMVGLEGVGLDI